jgi:hypothetical protein
MVAKRKILGPNVVDLRSYQQARGTGRAIAAASVRLCRHCGAGLMDGEIEDDCSSAGPDVRALTRKFYAE